jgi:YegS/Rv2252/BmrU family lipid kinase
MNSIFVVMNPVAGNANPAQLLQQLADLCHTADYHHEIYTTSPNEDLRCVIHHAILRGYNTVAAVGGDGTVSAVADALACRDVPLAIIPLGTGNLLARELGIPLQMEAACELMIEQPKIQYIDAMRVRDRTFISHISLGVYSQIIEATTPNMKQKFGRLAYIRTLLKGIRERSYWRFSLLVDGQPYHYHASMILAANIGEVGVPPLRWGPAIDPSDGRIDLCIVRAHTVSEYAQMIWKALRGQQDHAPQLSYLHAYQSVTIRADRAVPVRADGEIIGESAVTINILPQALEVIVPED